MKPENVLRPSGCFDNYIWTVEINHYLQKLKNESFAWLHFTHYSTVIPNQPLPTPPHQPPHRLPPRTVGTLSKIGKSARHFGQRCGCLDLGLQSEGGRLHGVRSLMVLVVFGGEPPCSWVGWMLKQSPVIPGIRFFFVSEKRWVLFLCVFLYLFWVGWKTKSRPRQLLVGLFFCFHFFCFLPLMGGKMIQFEEHTFQMGWKKTTN